MESASTAYPASEAALPIRRVLIATDFSEGAERACWYARAIADRHGAHVRLVHVLTVYEPELYGAVDDSPAAAGRRALIEERTMERFVHLIDQAGWSSGDVERVSRWSASAAQGIVEEAKRYEADVVVLGTHGRSGVRHALLGSVAEAVVRRAPGMVLVVPGTYQAVVEPPHRILMPVDFSESATPVLATGQALARRYGATLDLLHVIEPIPLPAALTSGIRSVEDALPDLEKAVHGALDDMARAVDGATAHVHVARGHAPRVISTFAAQHDVDLIVMATHGRTGIGRFFIGSVTERVLRAAPCPVLTIRTRPVPTRQNDDQ